MEYWQRQETIPWVRIHKLPEHVKFPHSTHVQAGLECQTCHGPVQEMEKVYQFSSLQMGWCIDCHRGDLPLSAGGGGRRCSAAPPTSAGARRWRRPARTCGGRHGTWPNQRASTDCVVCHY